MSFWSYMSKNIFMLFLWLIDILADYLTFGLDIDFPQIFWKYCPIFTSSNETEQPGVLLIPHYLYMILFYLQKL